MYPYCYPNCFNIPNADDTKRMDDFSDEDFPVPGTTSGQPVTPAAPPPSTAQAPDSVIGQTPSVITDIGFTQAYLKTQIGKNVRIEFLIGTNILTDRLGVLTDVGISYIIIRPEGTDDKMLCDIYSIKFITFYS